MQGTQAVRGALHPWNACRGLFLPSSVEGLGGPVRMAVQEAASVSSTCCSSSTDRLWTSSWQASKSASHTLPSSGHLQLRQKIQVSKLTEYYPVLPRYWIFHMDKSHLCVLHLQCNFTWWWGIPARRLRGPDSNPSSHWEVTILSSCWICKDILSPLCLSRQSHPTPQLLLSGIQATDDPLISLAGHFHKCCPTPRLSPATHIYSANLPNMPHTSWPHHPNNKYTPCHPLSH